MNCPRCQHENRSGRRFCAECGAPLPPTCPSCGSQNELGEKFCGDCGAPLARARGESAAPADTSAVAPGLASAGHTTEARKVVTIVFADLAGSTALHERLDAESARGLMERYYAALRAVVDAHDGTVVKLLGDGVMAAFGIPQVAEDDAIRAVRAAVAMQKAFRALLAEQGTMLGEVGLRVAVNTGEVVVSGAHDDVVGDPVNVAARLQEQGDDGDVVIGEATSRLVATLVTLGPLGSIALKGRAETVNAYRVVSLEPPARAIAAPFVGRTEELARLDAVYGDATSKPAARLAVVLGSPGLGKSRLIEEFVRRCGDTVNVLTAHCEAAGGATFAPLAEAIREYFDVEDSAGVEALRGAIETALDGETDRTRIVDGIAALVSGVPAAPEETFFVIRRLLGGIAGAKPVVLVVDDLQWAEPLLLDLIEHLVQWGGGVRLLVLVGARPELRDLRSSLVTVGGVVSEALTLHGLDAGAATRHAANVIGAADLPAAVAAKVLATSEGNPLFVGELVRMLVQEGALTKEGERWTTGASLDALEMPPTIHALLAARIERLRPEDCAVLERAAVVGRQFSRGTVAALLRGEVAELDQRLEALRRSELIEPDSGWLLGEPVLRFHHALIRDAAYRRLLKGTRAELHARLADWIEAKVGDAPEHDETIGWHLEHAHQLLGEIGPIDDSGRSLGERAAQRLASAGRRSLARDDVPVAADLLGRAIDRLEPEDPRRADLSLDWCEALLTAGDVGSAERAIEALGTYLGNERFGGHGVVPPARDRLRAWHTCFSSQLTVFTAPQELQAAADAVASAADELATLGDEAGEAKAHSVHALALARLGRVGACEAALDKALAAARKAGDRRRANAVLAGAPLAALWGPSPVTRASGRCLDVVRVLRITQGAPAVEAVALSCQGVLEALRGRTEAARRMIAASRKMVEELGIANRLFEADVFAGRIDLLEGDAAAAERNLRRAYEGLRDLGLGIDAARAGALLGRALLGLGDVAEAERLSHESEELAGDDLQAAIAWRGVRAEALARRGEHAAAVELAQAAVDIAAATDALLDHAEARLALAVALRAAGRTVEAEAEEGRARELWTAKGATVLAEAARRDDGGVAHAAAVASTHEQAWRRRIRPNAASAAMDGLEAAFRAGDLDAIGALLGDPMENVDHPNGTRYGREAQLEACARMLRTASFELRVEALATLGESLCLGRRFVTGAGTAGGRFDVAEYEMEHVAIYEIGDDGRYRRFEVFAAEHLNDAIAAFYERHAELLPEGPARKRAAATAHSLRAFLEPFDLDRIASAMAPAVEFVDHRRLVGLGSLHGSEALLTAFRALIDLTRDFDGRVDDVLAASDRAILARHSSFGTDRASGGGFERTFLELLVFGADGLLERLESFDTEHEAEALRRFQELTADPTRPELCRRVRPNAATAAIARIAAATAARDLDARRAALSEDYREIYHPTGVTYGRDQNLAYVERLFRSPGLMSEYTPLATLGERLGLDRRLIGASANRGGRFDVGEWANELLNVTEVDQNGLIHRWEMFAPSHLGAALACLYGRYAESLPEGAERVRAEAIASSITELVSASDASDPTSALGPAVEVVDHRIVGFGTLRGAKAVDAWSSMLALAVDLEVEFLDVLAAVPDAMVVKAKMSGRLRDGGGDFERVACLLLVFGADGRVSRYEMFEPDHEAEALTRFEAYVAESTSPSPVQRRVRPNAATASQARFDALVAARDLDAIATQYPPDYSQIHHPTGLSYGRDGTLASLSGLLRSRDPSLRHEPLATLGDALALSRRRLGARATGGARFDVGEYEDEKVCVLEVDERGQPHRYEVFAPAHLGEAIARLYELHAARLPAGPARERAEATAAMSASSTAALAPVFDLERFAAVLAPDVECIDRRLVRAEPIYGAEALVRALRSLEELAQDMTYCVEDVLDLAPEAILGRYGNSGTERVGGGLYERPFLGLGCYGPDGRLARLEFFDVGQEAVALARFDELVPSADERLTSAAQVPFVRRRVRENAATAMQAKFEAAIAARDFEAIRSVYSDRLETIEHQTGATYGADAAVASVRLLFRSRDAHFHIETLATLGSSLLLSRRRISASGTAGGLYDVAEYENEAFQIEEVGSDGRCSRVEAFAPDRLGDAVARLYGRHAELLTEGSERDVAAATARAVAASLQPFDVDTAVTALDPNVESVDHRVLGNWSGRGAEALAGHHRAMHDVAENPVARIDDVLALEPAMFLARWTVSGTARSGGGAWDAVGLTLWVAGEDGLVTLVEYFDVGCEAEALARFDELVGPPAESEVERHVPANSASAVHARIGPLLRASDFDGLLALFSEAYQEIHHPTGATYGRVETVASMRRLFRSQGATYESEPLATLGSSLILTRTRVGARATGGGRFDVGAYETEMITVMEVDEHGFFTREEVFAADHLGDAIACLYRRYAEQLPAGGERERATATADAVAGMMRPLETERFAVSLAPGYEAVDHRILGTWSASGPEEMLAHLRSMVEVASDVSIGPDDVLALGPHVLLTHTVNSGTAPEGGGAYERPYLMMAIFGSDGLLERAEFFDVGHEAEALEGFEEIMRSSGGSEGDQGRIERPHGLVFQNAATRAEERAIAAMRARDFEGFAALLAADLTHSDRRRHVQLELSRDEWLAGMREVVEITSSRLTHEALATRGERLALTHTVWCGAEGDVGASEVEILSVVDLDERGQYHAVVYFDPDDHDAAYAELDRRYEAGEGARNPESIGLIRAFREAFEARDWDRIHALCAPTFVRHDRRRIAVLEAAGPDAWIQNLRALIDLAPDTDVRYDHLECGERGYLFLSGWHGTREGGDFEIPFLGVIEADGTGKFARIDVYDPEQVDDARARFAELNEPRAAQERFANAATRGFDRAMTILAARDFDAFAALHASDFRHFDRRSHVQAEFEREQLLPGLREIVEMTSAIRAHEVLATRGERLALTHMIWEGAQGDVGPSEIEMLAVGEVDERGKYRAVVYFDADDLDAAYAELEERYTAGERGPAGRSFSEFLRGFAHRDWEALAALCADDFVEYDRRPVGMLGTTTDREAWVELFRVQVDLAPDTVLRIQHIRESARGSLTQFVWEGSRDGGAYEMPMCVVNEVDGHGRLRRVDIYEPEQLDQALARFEEVKSNEGRLSPFANAASRASNRTEAYWRARDWGGLGSMMPEGFRLYDRRPLAQVEIGHEDLISYTRALGDMPSRNVATEIVATRGDRLALMRWRLEVAGGDVGPSEICHLNLFDVDEHGELQTMVRWDADDLDAAYAELDARWEAGEAAAYPRMSVFVKQFRTAFADRDWEALAALLSSTFVGHDHRLVGWGTLRGPTAFLPSLRAMVELAPDAWIRTHHGRFTARGCIGEATWIGTRDGGEFESPYIVVMELDDAGLAERFDFYDPNRFEAAWARFEEIAGGPNLSLARMGTFNEQTEVFANAASRKWHDVVEAWRARDMGRFTQLQPRLLRYRDHRQLFQLDLGREEFIEFARPLLEMREAHASLELLATRGERLALMRVHMEVADDAVGPSEIDSLLLIETDHEGEITAYDRYDEEDIDAAYAELDDRWDPGDRVERAIAATVQINVDAFARRDWEAYATTVVSDACVRDHRLLGWGRTLSDAATLIRAQQALVELSPDASYRADHQRISGRAYLSLTVQVGTREGGAFETPFVTVGRHDEAGRFLEVDIYDADHQLDRAQTRFAEIAAIVPRRDALAAIAKPNAAMECMDRLESAINASDWDAARALCAVDFVWEDRRPLFRLSGGVDLMISSLRERTAAPQSRLERFELLGTAGDRVVVGRVLWAGGPPDGRFEWEYLGVAEVDEAGRLTAVLLFDPDDRRAAQREAWARWAAVEPVAKPWVALMSTCDEAYNDRDLTALRATWAEDIVVHDHRRTGFGRLEGADAYVEALSVLWDLAPDTRSEIGWYWLACDRHAALITNRRTGTIAGGGAYESEHLMLFVVAGDCIAGLEMFELEALEEASTRFEELRVLTP